MTEKEKELKSFNQCADALSVLDKRSILKVFHMLSIHFEVVPFLGNSDEQKNNFEANNTSENNSENNSEVFIEAPKRPVQKKNTTSSSTKKSKSTSSKDLTYLTDYDFRPSGSEGIKEFYEKYKSISNMENNLIFTYYFQEKRKEKEITMNLIYSSYRHIGLKIPSFPQTLIDTKARKGWIDTAHLNDLKVTREGINFIEHEIAKAND